MTNNTDAEESKFINLCNAMENFALDNTVTDLDDLLANGGLTELENGDHFTVLMRVKLHHKSIYY